MPKRAVPYSVVSILTRFTAAVLFAGLMTEKARGLHAAMSDTMPTALSSLLWLAMMQPTFWISLLAPLFYLGALMAAAAVFDRMDKGDAFGPAMVKGLKTVGRNLMCGAAAAIFIAPTLVFLVDTGFSRLSGLKYHLEIESLTIGLIGFVLYLLAKQGQTLKSELDQIV